MTRRKYEITRGDYVWSPLANEDPSSRLIRVLEDGGYTVSDPLPYKDPDYKGPQFRTSDPINSVVAAFEADKRTSTARLKVLVYLLANNGHWISRNKIREIGGDSGDRRYRELRDQGNWPIETRQFHDGEPWRVRLNLDKDDMKKVAEILMQHE